MSKTLCPYAKDCPVFKGKEDAGKIPLNIYRNVFCYRGMGGWTNCSTYNNNSKTD